MIKLFSSKPKKKLHIFENKNTKRSFLNVRSGELISTE